MRSLDALTLRHVATTLAEGLVGARVSKIQHLARHELTITFWGGGLHRLPGRHRLYINLGAEFPCLFLASAEECRHLVPTPLEKPTGLSMLLRKYLGAARCLAVSAPHGERLVHLDFETYDALGQQAAYRLSIELMGKHSNLLLIDTRTSALLGAARYVGEARNRVREIAPGLPYAPPPRPAGLPWLLRATPAQLADLWALSEGDTPQARARLIQERFWGLGGAMLVDLVAQSPDETAFLQRLARVSAGEDLHPMVLLGDTPDAEPDFRLLPPLPDDLRPWQACPSVHAMATQVAVAFWTRRRLVQQRREVLDRLHRQQRRLQARLAECADTPQADLTTLRLAGDRLLTALAAGELPARPTGPSVTLAHWADDAPPLTIAVDPARTWQENAERYYRRLKKARMRRQMADTAAQTLALQALYLEELVCLASQAESLADLSLLESDLQAVGAVNPAPAGPAGRGEARKKPLAVGILTVRSDAGRTLLVGRSAQGNGAILRKHAHPDDVWCHARQIPGAHVLVKTARQPLDDTTRAQAAQLAAYFSPARANAQVDVILTLARHVRHIPDSYPGHVTYRHEQTLSVRPDAALVARLLRPEAISEAIDEASEAPPDDDEQA